MNLKQNFNDKNINTDKTQNEVLVSVIMSTYNEDISILCLAIDSIINQSYKNIQFIIVNDNPLRRDLKELLDSYSEKDSRIFPIINEKNIGLAASLNKAINQSNGKYIARMDADDISMPERIQIQVEYLEAHSGCSLVCGNKIDINEKGEKRSNGRRFFCKDENIIRIMKFGSIIIHPTVMIRKDVIQSLNGYRLLPSEDYDLWLRFFYNGYSAHIMNDYLIYYRIREDGISISDYSKQYFSSKFELEEFKNGYISNNYIKGYEDFLLKNKALKPNRVKRINNTYRIISNRNKDNIISSIIQISTHCILCHEVSRLVFRVFLQKIVRKRYLIEVKNE